MNHVRAAWVTAVSLGLSIAVSTRTSDALMLGLQSQATAATGNKNVLPIEVTYPQIYATSDGETHFREISVPLTAVQSAPPAPPSAQSVPIPATTIRHAAYPPNWGASDRDRGVFHNASSARFITVRSGLVWIKTSDGDVRRFQPGDVIEVLDVAPAKGHVTWIGDEGAVILFSNHP